MFILPASKQMKHTKETDKHTEKGEREGEGEGHECVLVSWRTTINANFMTKRKTA